MEINALESRKKWMLAIFRGLAAGTKTIRNSNSGDIELNEHFILKQKTDYNYDNPVQAEIVLSQQEYLYSRFKNYAGMIDCILQVRLVI